MSVCVVDCSYFLSFIMPDEEHSSTDLARFTVYVPAIFYLECLNVLKTALKENRITTDQFDRGIWAFKDLPFCVDHFSSTCESLHTIARLALEYDLSSYDASYLELALRLRVPIGSHDKKLLNACASENIAHL